MKYPPTKDFASRVLQSHTPRDKKKEPQNQSSDTNGLRESNPEKSIIIRQHNMVKYPKYPCQSLVESYFTQKYYPL
jgi:hypothetical protein